MSMSKELKRRLERSAEELAVDFELAKKALLDGGCPEDEIAWSFHDKLYCWQMSHQERVVAAFNRGEITTA
jgi:hypothetical protein